MQRDSGVVGSSEKKASTGAEIGVPAVSKSDHGHAFSRSGWVMVALALAVAACSWAVIWFEWLMFDDDINILANPFLGSRAWSSVTWAFTQFDYIRRYVPLGWLWFCGVLSIDGYNAVIFHLASVVLHAANAVMAWSVFRTILLRSVDLSSRLSIAAGTRRVNAVAALCAFLWSLHPLRAENVGWISGQFYLLATTFALIAVRVLIGRETLPDQNQNKGNFARDHGIDWAGALIFAGSLLVYPVYLALPAILTLWFATRSGTRGIRAAICRLAWWWAVAAVVAGINAYAAINASGGFAQNIPRLSASDWLRNVVLACGHYLASTVWPSRVAVYYGPATNLFESLEVKIAASVVVLAFLLALVSPRTRRSAAVLAIAFLISLAPFVAQMDATFTPSDRYAVLWLAVACVAIGISVVRLKQRVVLATAVVGVLAIVCASRYQRALGQWRDTFALQQTIDERTKADPNLKLSFTRPALVFWWLGRQDESQRRQREALARFPGNPALQEANAAFEELKAHHRARVGASAAIPPLAVMHVDLGRLWSARGDHAAAMAHYRAALALAPEYVEAAVAMHASEPDRRSREKR